MLASRDAVERHVERQDVDARLAEQAEECGPRTCSRDELADAIFGQAPRLGNARHLEKRRLGRDMRVEAAAGRRDQIDREPGQLGSLL